MYEVAGCHIIEEVIWVADERTLEVCIEGELGAMLPFFVSLDVDLVVRDLPLHSVLPAILVGELKDLAIELDFPDDSVLLTRNAVDSAKAFLVSFLPLAVLKTIIKHVLGAELVPELFELRNSQWLDPAPDSERGGTRANRI